MTPSSMPRVREIAPPVTWPVYASAACFALACAGAFAAVVIWRAEK